MLGLPVRPPVRFTAVQAAGADGRVSAASLPYGQLARLGAEFQASMDALLVALFPNRYAESILFLAVARTAAPDWITDGRLCPPAAPDRAITVNALASSLLRPFETTRRHAGQFIAEDVFVKNGAGLTLSVSPANAARVVGFYRTAHDLLVRYIDDVASTCDLAFPGAAAHTLDCRDIVTRSLDIALMPLGLYLSIVEHWVGMLIWTTIRTANTRHITYDAELCRRYAVHEVPDDQHRPISLNAVARSLRLPYATAWRHCRQLEAGGMVSRRGGGWLVGAGGPHADRIEAVGTAMADYSVKRMRQLAMLGLDTDAAGARYLGDKPALMAL